MTDSQTGCGRFVVFEGGEGAGKTTQLREVLAWLTDCGWAEALQAQLPNLQPPILVTREPGGTELGQKLRHLLLHSPAAIAPTCELLLYAADRAQHIAERIEPHLQAGGLVLCDRFTDSTLAYQGFGRGLDLGMIETLAQIATGGRKPDLTLWFDVDPLTGLNRAQIRSGHQDRMEQATLAFHQRVHQGFAQRVIQAQGVRIDANCEPTTVTAAIQSVLGDALCHWYPQISASLLGKQQPANSLPRP